MIYRVSDSDLQQVASIRGLNVSSVSFSPDNQLVLLPSNQEDHVRLWSMATFQDIAVLPHAGGPTTVCFSGDGRRIATASLTSVCLWDLGGLKEKRLLAGHQGGVSAIEFGPDGTWLASTGADRTTRVWDVATGAVRRFLPLAPGRGQGLAISTDGRLLAISDWLAGTVLIWERVSGRELAVWKEGRAHRCVRLPSPTTDVFSPRARCRD